MAEEIQKINVEKLDSNPFLARMEYPEAELKDHKFKTETYNDEISFWIFLLIPTTFYSILGILENVSILYGGGIHGQ